MRKNLSGFTLIEIIIVIIIIGVIAGAAVPRFTGTFERVKASEGKQILLAILNAQKIYFLEHGAYSDLGDDLSELDINIPASQNFNLPNVDNNPDNVAQIERKGSTYVLKIKSDGTFTCDGGGCSQIGF